MKKFKLISIVTAAALPLSLCSCSLENFGYDSLPSENEGGYGNEKIERDYETSDIQEVNNIVRQLLDDIKISGNEKAVKDGIDDLIYAVDIASDAMAYSSVDSNLYWYDEDLEYTYEEMSENYYVIRTAAEYAIAKGFKSEYSELFKEYIDDDSLKYYTQKGMNLARAEGYASVDYRVSDENLDDYYDIAYDTSLSDDEKDLKCAEIYLEVLSNYDPETFYDNYYRDYTPEEIKNLAHAVRDTLIPVSNEIADKLMDDEYYDDIMDKPILPDAPFETIREYSAKLSSDIKKSADKINDEELFTISSGDECYTGSYTMDLPSENSALVYIYANDSYNDLSTAIHEFGHFHASLYDDTKACVSAGNIDIAEIQSQAMELLFMQFYDDIYGDQSDGMKLMLAYNMTDAVISSFLIGEFEYTVLTKSDELSPKEVIDLYDDILGDYAEGYPFYYISHMFESPGYYISYGVSALAALDIIDNCLEEPDKALEQYEKIAAVPANSKDVRFRSALAECGFSDVLTEEYIKSLGDDLINFSDKI